MANNKLPPEVHAIQGSKGMNMGAMLPEKIRARIPLAEWGKQPELFNKEKFVEETSQYLFDVYGIGTKQDRHTLWMLADQLDTYINARVQQDKHPYVIKINNGKTLAPNPFISVANEAMKNCIRIMNELGLTPKSRLAANKLEDDSPLADFLKGWNN
jgi:P27 family predicted phage terminase small subunit